MQKRLAVLDSARKEFIANASHELRTPIFSLAGFVELLADEDPDPESRAEFVGEMRSQVERLTKLTVDLLDLSKLDADAIQIRRERVDLAEVARRVVAEFGPTADRHGSEITIERGARGAATRRPGEGGSDHAYPDRQRAHPHAGGNRDQGRDEISRR